MLTIAVEPKGDEGEDGLEGAERDVEVVHLGCLLTVVNDGDAAAVLMLFWVFGGLTIVREPKDGNAWYFLDIAIEECGDLTPIGGFPSRSSR